MTATREYFRSDSMQIIELLDEFSEIELLSDTEVTEALRLLNEENWSKAALNSALDYLESNVDAEIYKELESRFMEIIKR